MQFFQKYWKLSIVSFLVLCAGIVWLGALAHKPRESGAISFLDVGEGDATLIVSRNGTKILIDTGPNRNTLAALTKALPLFDRHLDLVIEAYPDAESNGGLPFVLQQYHVGGLVIPRKTPHSLIGDEVQRLQAEKQFPLIQVNEGMNFDLHDGSTLSILSAEPGESLVLLYRDGPNCILFMGGLQDKTESVFVSTHSDIHCQVLKVGHHGSKHATSDSLLEMVHPQYAIISVGKDNRYEYPNSEVIERLTSHGVESLSTLERGTIQLISDGNSISFYK